ncbi:MAG: hypothetical protein AB1679_02745 [Actinomycetota bacterium]
MSEHQGRRLVAYGLAIPLIMFGVNYGRGVNRGESPGLAAVSSLIALAIVLSVGVWVLANDKPKGGEIRLSRLDEQHPGEGHQPRGWEWDERSKRWRKPRQQRH